MKASSFYPFRSERARDEYHALYMERARAWPAAAETRMVDTPDGQTFVRLSGDPVHPPLVLLPGSRDTSLMWSPHLPTLSAGHRVFALDAIYDIGMSVARRKLKTPEDLVNWLDEVLAVLVPEGSLDLAGMSYGGWLAGQYALRFPERVRKLVLIAPAATVLPVSLPFLLQAVTLLLPWKASIRQFLYWLLQDTVQSGAEGRAIVDQAVADWIVAQRSFSGLPLINATVMPDEALKTFNVPTLFLDGEHEKVYSAQKAASRLNLVAPQMKTEIIPGTGHDLWILRGELVARKMLDFLGEDVPLPGPPRSTEPQSIRDMCIYPKPPQHSSSHAAPPHE